LTIVVIQLVFEDNWQKHSVEVLANRSLPINEWLSTVCSVKRAPGPEHKFPFQERDKLLHKTHANNNGIIIDNQEYLYKTLPSRSA